MRIAILHYHLRPGGVTRVIQNSLMALEAVSYSTETLQTLVLAGEPPSSSMPIPSCVVVEALGYTTSSNVSSEQVILQIETTARRALGGEPDIWHIHNHALGKNLIIPALAYHLAQKGQHVLLQIHDFAEDGRPDNYKFLWQHLGQNDPLKLGAHLYPQGMHIHYALLNQRDLQFLEASGVKKAQLHYLPNAVSMEQAKGDETAHTAFPPGRVFFYPARAIRRKNLGEFLLWSAMAEEGDLFAVARSPQNPVARPIYDAWVMFSESLSLPVEFSVGEKWQGDFPSLLKSTYALVTTSVAEGFGLVFLEPWLAMRPLVGRNLPEITDALERAGVDLSSLYDRVDIPVEWIGRDRFRQKVNATLPQVYASYGRTARPQDIERAVEAAIIDKYIDFGRLNEDLQQSVIERLVRSPSLKMEITPSTLESRHFQNTTIQQNCQIVKDQFNLHEYGKRLIRLYQNVAESSVEPLAELNADMLLDQFLAPERFNLLRT